MTKYIFVTGGVVSSLGKGITAASLGRLLIERGLKVKVQKLDPYLNVNVSIMSPEQHGELFVTADGAETDLDLGHYERFLDIEMNKNCSYTTGKIYSRIFEKEAHNVYDGGTIQVVPHVTSEIKAVMKSLEDSKTDVAIIEIGGTVGDMEGLAYLEAIRQFERELKPGNYLHIHCTLVPYLESADEVKTKPTQHSVKELTSLGLNPDIIVCRTAKDVELSPQNKRKIAMFCNLEGYEYVIHNPDCKTIYEVPLVLNSQGLDRIVCEHLNLKAGELNLTYWKQMVETMESDLNSVNIAIVGKYSEVRDSYLSVIEAIKHGALKNRYRAKIDIVSSQDIEMLGPKEVLKGYDGIVVPGGNGAEGTEGMVLTAEFCRENKIPFLGISYGMQMAIVDFARNVANLIDANSTEVNPNTANPVISSMNEMKTGIDGNKSRLGDYECSLIDSTLARRLYGLIKIKERHKNRYEFNVKYLEKFEELGMIFSGKNTETNLVEIIEYADHPFFIGTIYHPEFKSRPYKPHPLFVGFMAQAISGSRKPTL